MEIKNIYGTVIKTVEGSSLVGSNLRDACLSVADLRGADLYGADLWGADLWGADLQDVNFKHANLRGTGLTPEALASQGAVFDVNTIFDADPTVVVSSISSCPQCGQTIPDKEALRASGLGSWTCLP